MIGGLVEQQHVGLGQQQCAQGHAAPLAAGEFGDVRLPRRQPQCIGGHFQGALQVVAVAGFNQGLEFALFLGQRIEVGIGVGVFGIHRIEAVERVLDRFDRLLDIAAHVFAVIELRFLGQVTDLDAGLRPRFAEDVGIDAGHDAQQCRFAGAVQTQHADLGAGKERQGDVFEDLTLRRNNLADAVHGEDVLGHGGSLSMSRNGALIIF